MYNTYIYGYKQSHQTNAGESVNGYKSLGMLFTCDSNNLSKVLANRFCKWMDNKY